MTKKSELPHSPRHLLIYDEDWEWLKSNYGPGSANEAVGIGGAVRTIIHGHIGKLKARVQSRIDEGRS